MASRKKPPAPAPSDETREALLERELARASEVLIQMEAAGSWQAVVSARRQLLQMHEELLAERDRMAQSDPLDDLSDDELLEAEIEELRALPDHMLEPLALAIMDQLGPEWVAHHTSRGRRPMLIEADDE